jgi:hypothetical protein
MSAITSLDALTPDTRDAVRRLLAKADAEGITYNITSTLRSCAEQDQALAQGETLAGGCMSWHVFGRAVDIHSSNQQRLGQIGMAMGFVWGGAPDTRYPDPPHFSWYGPFSSITQLCTGDCETSQRTYLAAVQREQALARAGMGTFVLAAAAGFGLAWWALKTGTAQRWAVQAQRFVRERTA